MCIAYVISAITMFLLVAFSVTLGAVTAMTHSQIEGYTVTKTDTIGRCT